jgi:hypothetical protein
MADNADDAIRAYLEWITSGRPPIRDEGRIAELEQRVEHTDDVLERLRLLSDLDRASNEDGGERLRQGFVEHAREWSAANGVTPDAFRRLGVPEADLQDAGLSSRRAGRGGGSGRSGGGQRSGEGRRSRVSRDDIVSALPEGTFTKADLVRTSGASPGAVTAALSELVESGRVRLLGPDPDHSSRGRAPLRYETT